jgi:Malate/lactate dehydrogenases
VKVTIVGAGAIGSQLAYALMLRRPGTELVIVNRDERKAWAKAFDLSHCLPELPGRSVRAGSVDDSAGSDLIIITVGSLPRPEGTRSEVLRDNVEIYRGLVPSLALLSPGANLVCVTNPVDAMAYAAKRLSRFPSERVLGSGTELDRTRLRSFAAESLGLEAAELDVPVVGEHGDTMVPLWSLASYRGGPLAATAPAASRRIDAALKKELLRKTRRAGWDIRQAGEHSSFGIAFAAARIADASLGQADAALSETDAAKGPALGLRHALCVSTAARGEYGLRDVYLSLPSRLGRCGAAERLSPPLADEELAALRTSASAVQAQMAEVDRLLEPWALASERC